ncbi:TadE/TadG family type IV pilus assembly protein [Janibacter sp. G1551]|uniref:TadE/TadG family type IV pilus assembly protein n=1 Tax=Janibacter sp. G1551 TaxID=3420440 RepID=UPI003D065277
MTTRTRSERGAAAIEFALVLPLLLLIVAGITDFGRAFYMQISTASAAREGARMISMKYTYDEAEARAQAAGGDWVDLSVTTFCTGGAKNSEVTAAPAAPFEWIFLDDIMSLFPGPALGTPTIASEGAMRCNG